MKVVKSPHFTCEEEQLLDNLTEKYGEVVMCKGGDNDLWREKDMAWQNIYREFKASSGKIPRSVKNLKKKFYNRDITKRTARKLDIAKKLKVAKVDLLMKKKLEFVRLKRHKLLAEHEFKVDILEKELELHEVKMNFLKEELEEHEMQLDNLKKELEVHEKRTIALTNT